MAKNPSGSNFAGIPGVLIQPLRNALMNAGFPAQTITDQGELNPAGLLAGVVDEIEFSSSATPTILVRTADLLQTPTGPVTGDAFVGWLRPSVTLRGRGGTNVIAPLGVPNQGGGFVLAAAFGAILGVGFLLGRASK